MTDTAEQPETEAPDWGEGDPSALITFPEYPANPHNHRYTISMNGQGPMVVVRGNTAQEVKDGFAELEAEGVGVAVGNAWAAFKAAATVTNGLGATQVPGGAPAPAQAPPPPPGTGPAYNPPAPPPGVPGQAPAAWQNAGAPTPPPPPQQWGGQGNGGGNGKPDRRAEYQQAGWYRVTVPFPKKGQFDGITAQYQMTKGRPSENGHFSFNSADKSWYVHPQYAGAFPMFSPVPA